MTYGSGLEHLWGGSSFDELSEMRQGLERDGGGGFDWNFHQNIPESLGTWLPGPGVELPPEH